MGVLGRTACKCAPGGHMLPVSLQSCGGRTTTAPPIPLHEDRACLRQLTQQRLIFARGNQ
jgi:hypothetical protein